MKGLEPCCAVVVAMCAVLCGLRLDNGIFLYGTDDVLASSKNLAGDKLNPKADVRRLDWEAPRALK